MSQSTDEAPASSASDAARGTKRAKRLSSAAAREAIVAATDKILCDQGASALNVQSVMTTAGISRTTFYRQFSDVYEVVEALIARLVDRMVDQSGAWRREPDAIGSAEQVHPNLIRSAKAVQPAARLLVALHDALGLDDRLRRIWRDQLLQPRIDTVAAAIRRDQVAGAISATIDADATALALSLMNEQLVIELICRNGVDPEEYARITAPIWESALFGERVERRRSTWSG